MVELRLPNIKGNDKEQLVQIRSYLYQLTEQLQWALNNISTSTPTYITQEIPRATASSSQQSFDSEVAFDELKPLIIKSADIVEAYYDEISTKLEGLYVAESDFGTFVEATEQTINQTSLGVEQSFKNIQQILTDVENLNFALAEVNAHINSGILYYDNGIPIYGIEIGQKTVVDGVEVFDKFARFTSDRLSFYDQNGGEVAYLSDYKLYITNADVTRTLKLGAYEIDTTQGFRVKYIGRG